MATTKENTGQAVKAVTTLLFAIAFVILILVFGFYRSHPANPYVKDVLALQGNAVQGKAIFLMNCAGCHGEAADGRVGPSLHGLSDRKSRVAIIQQVISGQTPPMPQFQPSTQEMADLLSYLEKL
ncbi:MAG TPA: cytochrome c [Leptolyngbyaceae cyanobacterium M33_DOE_097]|uniref:Cytochrome c n=1 Tax=Oscillatoriales cyanobacterium SpSt-418 TaxID=2282169 RepID=A0A7C3PFM7_9CYAN|nr:cytochrome c [Leptolyngbyaceae cyanobacterium M33_DOE_097]